jgi:hypothetical protein
MLLIGYWELMLGASLLILLISLVSLSGYLFRQAVTVLNLKNIDFDSPYSSVLQEFFLLSELLFKLF